jgi:hypothetical protein
MKVQAFLGAGAVFFMLAAGAHAQIAVSANDGKQLRPGDNPPGMRPDTIATIDLSQSPPKVLAEIHAPASMIGPPKAVVVAPDSSFAIVTCGQKADPSNPEKPLLAGTVTVLGISDPSKPRVAQTVDAAPGASGASINAAVNLALVANTSGSVSVFKIAHKKLIKVGDVQMEDGSGPTDVVFSRDGKKAYVVERGGSRISILNVDGTRVTRTGESFITGRMPYGMVITPDHYAVNTNLGGAMTPEPAAAPGAARPRRRGFPRSGTITLVDLRTNKVVDSAVVGPTPEHVDLAPNGKFVEVTVANGAASSMTDPKYKTTHGLMLVYGVGDGKLTKLASVDTGHWCQGATWNKDSNEILLQCATERDIEVYKFDGSTLTPVPSDTLHFNARPGSIATATNQ